ncbi:MAG: efflux RND transporter periplasmic adaptor subunit [Rhizomicrobium sp.]
MRGRFGYLVFGIIALAVVAGVGWYAGWFGGSRSASVLVVSGDIEAHESVLSFKTVQSRIVLLPFDEGATVSAGTVLARVDDSDYRQQVVIAEAALNAAQRQLDATRQSVEAARQTIADDAADFSEKTVDAGREQSLWSQHATSAQARDLARTAMTQSGATLERDRALERVAERNTDLGVANVKSAQAALDMARIVLGYTVLRAPFNGVILTRQAELGEVEVPGTPVVTLADLDHVWLRAYVNEPDIGKIRFGQRVAVTTDSYPNKIYRGRISFISSQAEFTPKSVETHAERVTLVYRVKIDLENPSHELVPGLPADARIELLPEGKP